MQAYLVTFYKRREGRNNEPVAVPAGTEGETSICGFPAHMPPPPRSTANLPQQRSDVILAILRICGFP
ncbi:hypothetical protein IG631_06831 [Alternaria alternata]|nr:hypothetical protein IG631_06831 [Alternaria alternata]